MGRAQEKRSATGRPARIPPPRPPIDIEEARRLHTKEGLSLAEVARELGYRESSIRGALRRGTVSVRKERLVADAPFGPKLYSRWVSICHRCSSPKHPSYDRYGARGFTVCKQWETFWPFYDWAIENGYRPGLSIDLIGSAQQFSPRTCKWITKSERARRPNSTKGRPARGITAFGETKSASEWARDPRAAGSLDQIRGRLRNGISPEDSIAAPRYVHNLAKDRRRTKKPRRRRFLDWDEIMRLYLEERLGAADIASRVGASIHTIRNGLKRQHARSKRVPTRYRAALERVWRTVRAGCEDKNDRSYSFQGARGARLCREWRSFPVFYEWALRSDYKPGLHLIRKQGTLLYSPENCRWVTRAEADAEANRLRSTARHQPRWTVTAFGETKGPTEWARDRRCAVRLNGLICRLRGGWPPEDAITFPSRVRGATDRAHFLVTAFGATKSLAEWSRDPRCRVTVATVRARILQGVAPEEAIRTPPFKLSRTSLGQR